jgi:DNA-binding transcriptional LysR family regulator
MLNQTDLSRVDLNLLVLFEVVMEERHVGRSAERLSLSPSAVSHGLGRLRSLLGDPLFLKTPRGVVPTDRAMELAAPVAEILARVRSVIASAEPFDSSRSTRRFVIGAPDGASSVFLPPLLAQVRLEAPGIDISVRQLLPRLGEPSPALAWRDAVVPFGDFPVRFVVDTIYEEDFVIAMRAGHPFASDPSLEKYCAMQHLVVSSAGDPKGFVDRVLAERALSRRVALTAPNFMFGLAVLAETDLISAYPRRFIAMHASRFGVVAVDAPILLGHFKMNSIVPKVAMMDAGLAWLVGLLKRTGQSALSNPAPIS